MANVGDNFTSIQSPEANFTNDGVDGLTQASLDSLDPLSRKIFSSINQKLETLGINLPELNLFDSSDSQGGQGGGGQRGGRGGGGYESRGNDIDCEPGYENENPNPPSQETGGRNYEQGSGPYNKRELAASLLEGAEEDFDHQGDGFSKTEVRSFRDTLAKGSLERQAINGVLRNFKEFKQLFNDEKGDDRTLSNTDLARLAENNQQKGRLNGYESDFA